MGVHTSLPVKSSLYIQLCDLHKALWSGISSYRKGMCQTPLGLHAPVRLVLLLYAAGIIQNALHQFKQGHYNSYSLLTQGEQVGKMHSNLQHDYSSKSNARFALYSHMLAANELQGFRWTLKSCNKRKGLTVRLQLQGEACHITPRLHHQAEQKRISTASHGSAELLKPRTACPHTGEIPGQRNQTPK